MKFARIEYVIGLLLVMSIGMVGCGGGSATPPPPAPPPAPTISSISPSSATAGGAAFTLTVNGSNFASEAVVQWNGSNRTTTFVNSTQLSAAITSGDIAAPGTVAVRVNQVSGTSFTSATFAINPANPTPSISELSPSIILVGTMGFTLTVNGTNFVSGATVEWNGSSRPTTFVSSSLLTVAISASDVAKSGPQTVTVVNPGSFPSNPALFLVNDPTPSITSLSPATAVAGQAFTLTVTGTDFVNGATVFWNGDGRTTAFVNSTQLTAAIGSGDVAQAGTATVFVANRFGLNLSTMFNYTINNPTPTIASLSPSSVMAGAAPLILTVNGSNFVSGATAQWNGSARSTQFLNSTKLNVAIPASDVAAQGTVQITVVNPAPSLGPSAAAAFTIDPLTSNPAPTITSLSDTSAPAGWPGFPLIINGTGFVAATTGQWNGLNRTSSVLSSIQLKGAIPLGDLSSAGPAQVSVFTPSPGGGSSNAVNFAIKFVPSGAVGVIERSSVATDLTEADADSGQPTISGDGRFVAFTSSADNLVPGDTDGVTDAFLRDTCIGAPPGCTPSVVRVSIATDGSQANQAISGIAISGNGRYVAFTSAATNLVPAGTSGALNVFLRDACFGAGPSCTPTTTLVSPDVNDSFAPALSSDGRYVTFTNGITGGCDYYSCDANDYLAVIRDTCVGVTSACTASTTIVSLANDGSKPDVTDADPQALISADGRYIAFQSLATNLVPNDTNHAEDVFLRDTCQGAPSGCTPSTVRVSVASDGSQTNGSSFGPSISASGRFVAFSTSPNIGAQDVFVRDTCFGVAAGCTPSTTKISVANDGSQSNGNSQRSSISADGRFVAFVSDATNLVAGDTSPFPKIFLRDTCHVASTGCTPSTIRLSVALDGTAANNQSSLPALSSNARYAVFLSLASNLGPGDTNQAFDAFVARTGLP